jgi:hypothetical protein
LFAVRHVSSAALPPMITIHQIEINEGGVRHALWINMSMMKIEVTEIKQDPQD